MEISSNYIAQLIYQFSNNINNEERSNAEKSYSEIRNTNPDLTVSLLIDIYLSKQFANINYAVLIELGKFISRDFNKLPLSPETLVSLRTFWLQILQMNNNNKERHFIKESINECLITMYNEIKNFSWPELIPFFSSLFETQYEIDAIEFFSIYCKVYPNDPINQTVIPHLKPQSEDANIRCGNIIFIMGFSSTKNGFELINLVPSILSSISEENHISKVFRSIWDPFKCYHSIIPTFFSSLIPFLISIIGNNHYSSYLRCHALSLFELFNSNSLECHLSIQGNIEIIFQAIGNCLIEPEEPYNQARNVLESLLYNNDDNNLYKSYLEQLIKVDNNDYISSSALSLCKDIQYIEKAINYLTNSDINIRTNGLIFLFSILKSDLREIKEEQVIEIGSIILKLIESHIPFEICPYKILQRWIMIIQRNVCIQFFSQIVTVCSHEESYESLSTLAKLCYFTYFTQEEVQKYLEISQKLPKDRILSIEDIQRINTNVQNIGNSILKYIPHFLETDNPKYGLKIFSTILPIISKETTAEFLSQISKFFVTKEFLCCSTASKIWEYAKDLFIPYLEIIIQALFNFLKEKFIIISTVSIPIEELKYYLPITSNPEEDKDKEKGKDSDSDRNRNENKEIEKAINICQYEEKERLLSTLNDLFISYQEILGKSEKISEYIQILISFCIFPNDQIKILGLRYISDLCYLYNEDIGFQNSILGFCKSFVESSSNLSVEIIEKVGTIILFILKLIPINWDIISQITRILINKFTEAIQIIKNSDFYQIQEKEEENYEICMNFFHLFLFFGSQDLEHTLLFINNLLQTIPEYSPLYMLIYSSYILLISNEELTTKIEDYL